MLNKSILAAITAALLVLVASSEVSAYGAAHVGRTAVGPNGAYHSGKTAVAGPGGGYAVGGRTTAVGAGGSSATRSGGVYHSGSVGYGQYPNTTTYHSGTTAKTSSYSYVR